MAAYVRTPVSAAEMKAAIQAALPGWPDQAVAVLGAQWGVETGNGVSEFNYNPAGVTGSYQGQTVTPPGMSLHFKSYPDLQSGVVDWLNLLKTGYPQAWAAASRGDLEGFAANTAARYCGCDPAKYAAALRSRLMQWMHAHGLTYAAAKSQWPMIVGVTIVGGLAWWLLSRKR